MVVAVGGWGVLVALGNAVVGIAVGGTGVDETVGVAVGVSVGGGEVGV
jgi:hypothetical protein